LASLYAGVFVQLTMSLMGEPLLCFFYEAPNHGYGGV